MAEIAAVGDRDDDRVVESDMCPENGSKFLSDLVAYTGETPDCLIVLILDVKVRVTILIRRVIHPSVRAGIAIEDKCVSFPNWMWFRFGIVTIQMHVDVAICIAKWLNDLLVHKFADL